MVVVWKEYKAWVMRGDEVLLLLEGEWLRWVVVGLCGGGGVGDGGCCNEVA